MNRTLMDNLYGEFLEEGQLDDGDCGDLAILLKDEYFFRGGSGDAGDVEMAFWTMVVEPYMAEGSGE